MGGTAYGEGVRNRGVAAIAWYTLLRVGLFLCLWLPIQVLTPLRGLWAIVIALVGSGVISMVLLNRQRNAMGLTVGNFFTAINERIEASARAEDWLESETEPEHEPVSEHGQAGGLENGDQTWPNGAAEHGADGSDHER